MKHKVVASKWRIVDQYERELQRDEVDVVGFGWRSAIEVILRELATNTPITQLPPLWGTSDENPGRALPPRTASSTRGQA